MDLVEKSDFTFGVHSRTVVGNNTGPTKRRVLGKGSLASSRIRQMNRAIGRKHGEMAFSINRENTQKRRDEGRKKSARGLNK
jgi:hypothetical protein